MKPSIALEVAKRHLRVEHELDDLEIALFAEAAVDRTLQEIGLSGCVDSGQVSEPCGSRLIGFLHPVATVTAVEVLGSDGVTWTAVPSSVWALKGSAESRQWVEIATVAFIAGSRYRVHFDGGWPEDKVPAWFQMAALFLIAHYYENRGSVVVGQGVAAIELPHSFTHLCRPHRTTLFA